jgi:uncharacterized protein YdeI (YjbR/CyaY-like superfamily)
MEITETFYARDRDEWRAWLAANHDTAAEIWLVYPKKATGEPRVAYEDAVEEALCYGWIDGIAKSLDDGRTAQRFTPRRKRSNWSELNRERARRLIAEGKMEPPGFATLPDLEPGELVIPDDIRAALEAEPGAWENFQTFPDYYRRVRVGYVEEVRKNTEAFRQRLANLVRRTAKGERFGTMR